MAIIASDNGKNFTPAPEGLHRAVCVDVIDLGMVAGQWGQRHKVRVVWQIEECNPENHGLPFQVSRMYTVSLNEKASLRKDLEMWRGKRFTKDELSGFDLEKLINANCQVQVIHSPTDDGKIWANVQAIIPASKGVAPIKPHSEYIRVKDRVPDEAKMHGDSGELYDNDIPF